MAKPWAPPIYFYFQNVSASLSNRNKLKTFIAQMFKKEKKKLGYVNYIFCSDQALIGINRKYRRHDFYTDILTFDLSVNKNEVQAEIYISVDRVKENASRFEATFSEELRRVMFHGVLHLCGYNDSSGSQKKLMRTKEDFYLVKYNLFHVKHSP